MCQSNRYIGSNLSIYLSIGMHVPSDKREGTWAPFTVPAVKKEEKDSQMQKNDGSKGSGDKDAADDKKDRDAEGGKKDSGDEDDDMVSESWPLAKY